jgi:hypothetical protein
VITTFADDEEKETIDHVNMLDEETLSEDDYDSMPELDSDTESEPEPDDEKESDPDDKKEIKGAEQDVVTEDDDGDDEVTVSPTSDDNVASVHEMITRNMR